MERDSITVSFYGSCSFEDDDSLVSDESSEGTIQQAPLRYSNFVHNDDEEKQVWLRNIADFLGASTGAPQLVMWGFLTWFIVTISLTKDKPSKPFKDAVVIMMLIGVVLNANGYAAFKYTTRRASLGAKTETSFREYAKTQPFSILRLFMIPYCVSCYSGVANSTPGFISILPSNPAVLIPAALGAIVVPLGLRLLDHVLSNVVYPMETTAHLRFRRQKSLAIHAV